MAKCKECGQPMLPPGAVKRPNEYDHAQGCPLAPADERPSRPPEDECPYASEELRQMWYERRTREKAPVRTLAERITETVALQFLGLPAHTKANLLAAIERVLAEDLKGLLDAAEDGRRALRYLACTEIPPTIESREGYGKTAERLRRELRKFRERRAGE